MKKLISILAAAFFVAIISSNALSQKVQSGLICFSPPWPFMAWLSKNGEPWITFGTAVPVTLGDRITIYYCRKWSFIFCDQYAVGKEYVVGDLPSQVPIGSTIGIGYSLPLEIYITDKKCSGGHRHL